MSLKSNDFDFFVKKDVSWHSIYYRTSAHILYNVRGRTQL